MRRLWIVPVFLLLAAGCATAPTRPADVPVSKGVETADQGEARRAQAARPAYNLAGYPPAVRDGYIDGCETAKGSRYGRKDAGRFSGDPQYQMGWNDGYGICGTKR